MKRNKTRFRWMSARREVVVFFRTAGAAKVRVVFPAPETVVLGLTA